MDSVETFISGAKAALVALCPAIREIDGGGCIVCIGTFVDSANATLYKAMIPYHFKYDWEDDCVTVEEEE